jgi:hypothetical protein
LIVAGGGFGFGAEQFTTASKSKHVNAKRIPTAITFICFRLSSCLFVLLSLVLLRARLKHSLSGSLLIAQVKGAWESNV